MFVAVGYQFFYSQILFSFELQIFDIGIGPRNTLRRNIMMPYTQIFALDVINIIVKQKRSHIQIYLLQLTKQNKITLALNNNCIIIAIVFSTPFISSEIE